MGAKILVVDDHEVMRRGVRSLIEGSGREWEVCGEAATGNQAIEAVQALRPDVVILDIAMPGMSGIEAASRIAGIARGSRILLFSMYESKRLAAEARGSGARGYVLKSQAAHHLIQAIEAVLAGGGFFGGPERAPDPESDAPPTKGPLFCLDFGWCGV